MKDPHQAGKELNFLDNALIDNITEDDDEIK